VKGKAEAQDDAKAKLLASELLDFEQAKMQMARDVTVRIPISWWERSKAERLREILDAHPGDCPVSLELVRPGGFTATVAASAIRVKPGPGLRDQLEGLLGPGSVRLGRQSGNGAARAIAARAE
jgi:DNA polymerase III subunit alpha